MDAVVAQSIFSSQNAQNTSCSEHFWKLRGRKGARPCGAKHVWKSKVSKTDGFGAILDVEMWKKCTPMWHEAHLQVKSVKNYGLRPLLGVEMLKKCTPLWRQAHLQVKSAKDSRLLDVEMPKKCTPLWREARSQVKSVQN